MVCPCAAIAIFWRKQINKFQFNWTHNFKLIHFMRCKTPNLRKRWKSRDFYNEQPRKYDFRADQQTVQGKVIPMCHYMYAPRTDSIILILKSIPLLLLLWLVSFMGVLSSSLSEWSLFFSLCGLCFLRFRRPGAFRSAFFFLGRLCSLRFCEQEGLFFFCVCPGGLAGKPEKFWSLLEKTRWVSKIWMLYKYRKPTKYVSFIIAHNTPNSTGTISGSWNRWNYHYGSYTTWWNYNVITIKCKNMPMSLFLRNSIQKVEIRSINLNPMRGSRNFRQRGSKFPKITTSKKKKKKKKKRGKSTQKKTEGCGVSFASAEVWFKSTFQTIISIQVHSQ